MGAITTKRLHIIPKQRQHRHRHTILDHHTILNRHTNRDRHTSRESPILSRGLRDHKDIPALLDFLATKGTRETPEGMDSLGLPGSLVHLDISS